jgi:hypothetical protein
MIINKQHYETFQKEFKKYNPNFSDEFLEEIYNLRIEYWKEILENFDNYFDI